jgi:hypothetical protein
VHPGSPAIDPPFDPARYEFVRTLGTGGAGTVYLALDRETGEQLALKKLDRLDQKSVLRFKREFRALANLHHPNLIRLYDLGLGADVARAARGRQAGLTTTNTAWLKSSVGLGPQVRLR